MLRLCAVSTLALAFVLPSSAGATSEVTHLPAEQVKAAFAKGMPLIEVENYKVHASRREAAGQVEVHTHDTDVIYVLSGTATFVTGGQVVGGRETAPEEIRGQSISGGIERRLAPGDVLVVPHGLPHWFRDVPGPLTYYVVKVRAEVGR